MKSCSICASTIDQCVHTSIAPCHALTQPCYALPCLNPNVLHLAKSPLGVTMMPLGAPSISKYGSLVRPDAQIVALRLRLPPLVQTLCKARNTPPIERNSWERGNLGVSGNGGNCGVGVGGGLGGMSIKKEQKL